MGAGSEVGDDRCRIAANLAIEVNILRRIGLVLSVACATPAAETITYSGEVREIVSEHCVSCHRPGGAAPFTLDTYEAVSASARPAIAAMEAGRMPPWSPDPECRDYVGQRMIPADDLAAFRAWVDADVPEGEATEPLTWEGSAFTPTDVYKTEAPFTPVFDGGDSYRCFVLDAEFDTSVYVLGTQVVPGSSLVHHVLAYALVGDQLETMRKLDAADDGPGYACFGGPVPTGEGAEAGDGQSGGLPFQIGAWVPGSAPIAYPDGSALRIPAGANIVIQVHYSAVAGDPEPDLTTFEVQLTSEVPTNLVGARPLPILDLDIAAGVKETSVTQGFTNWSTNSIMVRSTAGHMHLLGEQVSAYVRHADGSDSCLLDIPEWDFNWQQSYQFLDDEWVEVAPGDTIDVTCVYDNSVANQPVIDGVPVVSADVTWGDGTLDEMCVVYLGVVTPFAEEADPTAAACAASEPCVQTCDGASFDCLLSCETLDGRCRSCTFKALTDCVITSCPLQSLQIQSCLKDCGVQTTVLDGSTGACMKATCPDQYEAFLSCADDRLTEGACDVAMDACGVAF